MDKVEKIVSVDVDGGISFMNEECFNDFYEEKCKEIKKTKNLEEKFSKSFNLALLCERHGDTRNAVSLLSDILLYGGASEYSLNHNSKIAQIALRAYKKLGELVSSDDEYVWETSSQTINELWKIFENR